MATDTVGAQPLAKAPDRTWVERLSEGFAYLKRLYVFLLPLRFSFLALAVVGFAFLISDQGHDIIAAMTENDPRNLEISAHPWQRFFFVPLVSFLAVQIWYWSRTLLRVCFPGMPAAHDFPRTTVILPRALGVAAYVIMLLALYRVGREYEHGGGQPLTTLWRLAGCLAAAMVLFVLFCMGRRRMLEKRGHSLVRQKPVHQFAVSTKWLLGGTFAISVLFFLSSCFFVQRTGRFGSMGIVLLSMALWVSFGSILVYLGTKVRMPVLTLMLGLALLVSPLADNHVLHTLPGTADLVTSRPTVTEAFDRWSARLAHDYPNEAQHPVFVVATEGGGIRAAYWTAAVLTALDDGIPGFRDHLFAVSAVSGGAVGSAAYAALVTRQMDSGGTLQKLRPAAQEMLSYDSLAPTLSAMTQQDFVQRFIPYPFLPDRARALEGGWETAWRDVWKQKDDRFAHGFLALLHGREDRMPSFFLNGTTVETGERMIGSNCRITSSEFRNALDVFAAAGSDLRVSTTAHNSARFTYVSPAGTFRRTAYTDGRNDQYSPYDCKAGDRCEHVVDGGYLDNSGAITAAEILETLQHHLRDLNAPRIAIDPHVIIISFEKDPPARAASERWLDESLSPVRALMSTRGARADLAVSRIGPQTGAHVIDFHLVQRPHTIPMPLGWLLSLHTRTLIDAQVGDGAQENKEAMRQVADALKTTALPDAVQRSAAAAPMVKEIRQSQKN